MSNTLRQRGLMMLAEALGAAICKPKLHLGRRRHDNDCDECGASCGRYAMEKLDFPLDDLSPEASSSREKLRAMLNARYRRYCLGCSVDLESDSDSDVEEAGRDD